MRANATDTHSSYTIQREMCRAATKKSTRNWGEQPEKYRKACVCNGGEMIERRIERDRKVYIHAVWSIYVTCRKPIPTDWTFRGTRLGNASKSSGKGTRAWQQQVAYSQLNTHTNGSYCLFSLISITIGLPFSPASSKMCIDTIPFAWLPCLCSRIIDGHMQTGIDYPSSIGHLISSYRCYPTVGILYRRFGWMWTCLFFRVPPSIDRTRP